MTQFLYVVSGGGTRVRARALHALHRRLIDPTARRAAAAVRGTSEQLTATAAAAGTKTKTNNKRLPAETAVVIMILHSYWNSAIIIITSLVINHCAVVLYAPLQYHIMHASPKSPYARHLGGGWAKGAIRSSFRNPFFYRF